MISMCKENLFRNDISIDCKQKEYEIDRQIDFFDEEEFRQKSVEDLVEEWYELYKYKDLPVIDFENAYLEDEPIVGREQTSINIYIPLDGELDSLCYQPYNQCLCCSNYYTTISYENNSLLMPLNIGNKVDLDIDELISSTIESRKKNIITQYQYLKKDIEHFNYRIRGHIKNKFEELYKKVQVQIEIEQKTKKSKYLKVQPKHIEPIKLEERKIETSSTNIKNVVEKKVDKIIALEKDSYLQIYNNLKELSVYAQRLPKSYYKLSEEENRDQLINALNLKLTTATASGETFNVRGKSDIIIVDNKVIYYIAECKLWNGEKKFKDAIDQLLSYISQDVFYTSLIVFNKKNKNVIEEAVQVIKSHDSYVKEISEDRFKFKHPKNDRVELEISLVVFDVFYAES